MFVFKGNNLLARDGICDLETPPWEPTRDSHHLPPAWQDLPAWCELEEVEKMGEVGAGPTEGAMEEPTMENPTEEWINLRVVWQRWGEEAFARAGTAYQYMNWLRHARFCSSCGAPLSPRKEERGLECGSCGRVVYAPLHPAIIVAVEHDGKLLLAHNTRMPWGRYSVIAGFVEPGESLEQTVRREIMEEVGIEVKDIRYFGSQPWPFPCSLMLGFTARWKRGELRPDGTELDDAGWFAPHEFPDIPPGISISRKLIDDFALRTKGI